MLNIKFHWFGIHLNIETQTRRERASERAIERASERTIAIQKRLAKQLLCIFSERTIVNIVCKLANKL